MKWRNKNISELSDDELKDAIHRVSDMDKFRLDQLDKARKRHKAIFDNHPATENPEFTKLVTELNNQFKLRKLDNVS